MVCFRPTRLMASRPRLHSVVFGSTTAIQKRHAYREVQEESLAGIEPSSFLPHLSIPPSYITPMLHSRTNLGQIQRHDDRSRERLWTLYWKPRFCPLLMQDNQRGALFSPRFGSHLPLNSPIRQFQDLLGDQG